MSDAASDVDQQLGLTTAAFVKRFGRRPTVAAAAPGRVNLIGEHTDYNDGFVMPMAIDRQTVIVAAPREDQAARVISTNFEQEAAFDVGPALGRGEPAWSNYLRGVAAGWLAQGRATVGFDAAVTSTVPVGGGLSSSASIEVAAATLLEALNPREAGMDPLARALLCQQAEHHFAGVPCGIMDQLTSILGRSGHALLIDCRSRQAQYVPFNDAQVAVLIINSNVKHELVGGEYARRRQQCEAAARARGVQALRDATLEDLEAAAEKLDPLAFRRARHVITENNRTLAAAQALRESDWSAMGRLMAMSHASLRDDFQVSTPELDTLAALAQRCAGDPTAPADSAAPDAGGGERAVDGGAAPPEDDPPPRGVIGARMTGGGFGGCTVTLVHAHALDAVGRWIARCYKQTHGIEPTLFATRPAEGARRLDLAAHM